MSDKTITNTPLARSFRKSHRFSGFIIIRLKSEHEYKEDNYFDIYEDNPNNHKLYLPVRSKPCSISRLIGNISVKQLKVIEDIARKSNLPPLRSLSSYWRLDYRNNYNNLDEIISEFNEIKDIDLVYPELLTYDSSTSYYNTQDYLQPNLKGLDIESLWEQKIKGEGVGLIDLEQGWMPHEELPKVNLCRDIIVNHNAHNISYYERNGEITDYEGTHGTGVLGIIAARHDDSNTGIKGIAPNIDYIKLASHYNRVVNANGRAAEAIIGVISKLFCGTVKVGDILLIEFQKGNDKDKFPAEVELANFDAIRLASALGFIVIEAAGNGIINLDTYSPVSKGLLNMRENDSGAIMVGAAVPVLDGKEIQGYRKNSKSNWGRKIDCFAPVEYVNKDDFTKTEFHVTIGGKGNVPGDTTDNDEVSNNYQNFTDTSLASAIIAGAAVLVQSAYFDKNESYLSPSQMRYLLKKGGIKAEGDKIGIMPNLTKAIEAFSTISKIYIQTHKNFKGKIPFDADINIYKSKDIIIRSSRIDNLTDESNFISEGLHKERGQINYIYLKIKSKGSLAINNVKASIYLRKADGYMGFNDWELIKEEDSIVIPPISTSQLAGSPSEEDSWKIQEIVWELNSNLEPHPKKYCLLVIVRQTEYDSLTFPLMPISNLNSIETILNSEQTFEQFVRNNNNVACLKFTIP